MLSIAKAGLVLLGVLVVAGILALVLGSGTGKGSELEEGVDNPSVSGASIPAIDANAPADTRTATFALG
jgi:hypothetical protein